MRSLVECAMPGHAVGFICLSGVYRPPETVVPFVMQYGMGICERRMQLWVDPCSAHMCCVACACIRT